MSDITGSEGLSSALDEDALDLEIADNEQGLAALLDGDNQHGELQNNGLTGDLAIIRGGIDQPEVVAKASSEWDQKSSIQQEVQRLYADLRGELANATVDAVRRSPENAQVFTEGMTSGMSAIEEAQNHPMATELAIIQRAASVPLAQAMSARAALHLGMKNDIVGLLDEQSIGDKILDFAGIFVPARGAIEWEDVKAGVNADKQLSAYLSGDSIAGLVTSFQSLPVERAEAIWPLLRDTIIKASGLTEFNDPNIALAASMLMAFMEPDGGARASLANTVDLLLEGAASIPGAVKAVKAIRLKRKLAKVTSLKAGELPARDKAKVATAPNKASFHPPTILNDVHLQVSSQTEAIRKAMESVMLSTGELAVKEGNIIKVLARAGDKQGAVRMNIAAMSDKEVARVIGITSDDAVQNMMPFQTNKWKPQVVEGLMPDAGKALNDFYRAASKQVTDVTTGSRRLRVGAVHRVDRVNQRHTFEQEVERVGEDILQDGYILDDIKITGENSDAFTFQYTITDTTSDGGARTITGRRSWKVGQMNSDYTATAEDLATTSSSDIPFQSPTSWSLTKPGAGTDFNDAAKEAILVSDLRTAVKADMSELWVQANQGISGPLGMKQRRQVNALDIEGDEFVNPETMESGKVFLPEELLAKGVTDENVIAAYYNRRLLSDALYQIQDSGVRREYELLGFNRSVVVGHGDNAAQLFVKPYNDVNAARSALASKSEFNIYDPSTGKVFRATQDHIDKVYADGRQIVRSKEDWNTSGNDLDRSGDYVEYIAVQRADLRPLPDQVTHYKYGYVPKVNEGIEVVIQRKFKIKKAGDKDASTTEAMRAFMSKSDAEKFRLDLVAKHSAKYNIPLEEADQLYITADGSKMSQIQRASNSLSSSKGLFRGTRAKDELLMGLEGKPLERMQPEELMGRWLDHVAGGATQNELRIGREQEWLNTVRRLHPKVAIKGFDGTVIPNDEQGKALEKLRGQLRIWNSVPSRKETLFEASVQRTHDWVLDGGRMLGANWEGIPEIMKRKKTPEAIAGYLKGGAMHTMLGSLNPAQIIVQGSAMTVALSLADPRLYTQMIQRGAKMSFLDTGRTTSWRSSIYRGLPGTTTDIPDDMKEMYVAWERSGLREAVRNNADLDYVSSTGLGMTRDVLRDAENVSLTFYRMGELMNRRMSYSIAFDNWRVANPTKKLDDLVEQQILKDANLFMMELNSANRAWFQGGNGATQAQQLASVTTQFMQVMTKTVELSMKGEMRGGFSVAQKRRIALGQIAAYGTAGVPIMALMGSMIVNFLSDTMDDPSSPANLALLETAANTANQGAVGFFTREIVGADIETSSRLSLLAGVRDTIEGVLTNEDPVWQRLLGPSNELRKRTQETAAKLSILGASSQMFGAMETMAPMLFSSRVGQEILSKQDVMSTMAIIGEAMEITARTMTTTGRNFTKAKIMNNQNEIYNRRGTVTVREDFSFATEVAQAAGWGSTAEANVYEQQSIVRSETEHMQNNVQLMLSIYHRYAFMHDFDPAYGRQLIRTKQVIEESFGNNPQLVEEFNSRLEARILHTNETAEDRALGQYIKQVLPENVAAGYIEDQRTTLEKLLGAGRVTLPFSSTSGPNVEE